MWERLKVATTRTGWGLSSLNFKQPCYWIFKKKKKIWEKEKKTKNTTQGSAQKFYSHRQRSWGVNCTWTVCVVTLRPRLIRSFWNKKKIRANLKKNQEDKGVSDMFLETSWFQSTNWGGTTVQSRLMTLRWKPSSARIDQYWTTRDFSGRARSTPQCCDCCFLLLLVSKRRGRAFAPPPVMPKHTRL